MECKILEQKGAWLRGIEDRISQDMLPIGEDSQVSVGI